VTLDAQSDQLADKALSDFTDITRLRSGRLATVYRAREIATQRTVALKVLDSRDYPARVTEAFDREATVLSALGSHPNIVTLYRRLALTDGRPTLVLEMCDGSLSGRLVSTPDALSIGIKIAGALESAHRGGVLHRDVRPENILLTSFGEPTLSDFGVATLHLSAPQATALFEFATVHTAPELIEGGAVSPATDVYGLASTIYELVSGESAFHAYEGESTASVCLRILRDPVAPIVAPTVPLELSDVLLWGLAKDPNSRPPSVAWLADEFAHIAAQQGWPRTRLLVREPAEPVGTNLRLLH
jgi:serine/threonine protein kinase